MRPRPSRPCGIQGEAPPWDGGERGWGPNRGRRRGAGRSEEGLLSRGWGGGGAPPRMLLWSPGSIADLGLRLPRPNPGVTPGGGGPAA